MAVGTGRVEYCALGAAGDMEKTRQLIARASGTLGVIVSVVTLFGILGSGVVTALFGAGWFIDDVRVGK